MEKATHAPSRRDFLKAGGLALLGSAAAAGAFKATSPVAAFADEVEGAVESQKGIANFETDLYSEVFPTNVRFVPVVDAPTDMDRRGEVAFEMREIGEEELVRTEDVDVLVAGLVLVLVCVLIWKSERFVNADWGAQGVGIVSNQHVPGPHEIFMARCDALAE
ncbi:twin-arginine translocation signal domain-containing protein [Eggerthellaceae bacterium 3-80]